MQGAHRCTGRKPQTPMLPCSSLEHTESEESQCSVEKLNCRTVSNFRQEWLMVQSSELLKLCQGAPYPAISDRHRSVHTRIMESNLCAALQHPAVQIVMTCERMFAFDCECELQFRWSRERCRCSVIAIVIGLRGDRSCIHRQPEHTLPALLLYQVLPSKTLS